MTSFAKGISLSVIILALSVTLALGAPDLSATGSASVAEEPGYEGYWKYCYEVTWNNLPHGVSYVDFLLYLIEECPCVCTPGYFAFEDTVGTGTGIDGGIPCTVYYYGLFCCDGDMSVPVYTPLIKFEPYPGDCEPDVEGTAHLCFYSVAAPVYGTWVDYLVIKYSTEVEYGTLDGPLPGCEYGVSGTERSSWGQVKALYR